MLRIVIEKEETQKRYIRLKDSLGSPTDSILIDILLDAYGSKPIEVVKQVTDAELVKDWVDNSTVQIDLDDNPKKSRKKNI